jgi:hypothetical protein
MATEEEEDRFKLLKDACVNARDSLNYRISRGDLEELVKCVSVLHERTEAICKEYIATLKPNSAAR